MKYKTNFKSIQKGFNASMLEIGEMMEVTEECYSGHVLLRCYGYVVSLFDPKEAWDIDCSLTGRKLLPGESITLTQE